VDTHAGYMLPLVIKLAVQMCHPLHLKMMLQNMFFVSQEMLFLRDSCCERRVNNLASTFQVYAAPIENLGCTASDAPYLIDKCKAVPNRKISAKHDTGPGMLVRYTTTLICVKLLIFFRHEVA
jgi:hypothetical protein